MSGQWKPGDVALVRPIYCDHPDVIAVRTGVPPNMGWSYSMRTSDGSSTRTWASDPDGLTVVRPLVVIDPAANPYSKGTASWIDWIEHEYLVQSRPPEPDEPTDPKAHVTDRRDNIWRLLADGDWVCTSGPDIGEYLVWWQLAKRGGVEVLSEGYQWGLL